MSHAKGGLGGGPFFVAWPRRQTEAAMEGGAERSAPPDVLPKVYGRVVT
ncbi:MAG: hypothetical protein LH654_09155 [Thermoleophilia bacterium]|nr:hypothetical protein [Thermoleophilia bacterium]